MQTTASPPLSRSALFALFIVFTLLWFAQLNFRHLLPSDEGRYAEMAREMFVTGDWITPRYNGYKYFEKPPLQTWFNALTFLAFGIGDWQARLYTAVAGYAGVLVAGLTGARVFGRRAGFAAAVVLASSPYWNLMGHFNTLDMGLSLWMQVALCAVLLAQRPQLAARAVRGWMWTAWAAMALAVLSKGLIGIVLPGAVLVVYTLVVRDWALWRRLYLLSGTVLFAVIVVPWFVLVDARNPEFFHFFFIYEHVDRFLRPDHHRTGPLYYFVPVLLVGMLPWLSTTIPALRHAVHEHRRANGFSPGVLLLVWSGVIFVFFSVSESKLVSYVLPVAPALALLVGAWLPGMTAARWRKHLFGYGLFLIAAAFGALALGRMGSAHTPNALYRAYQVWVYVALALAFAGVVVALRLNRGDTTRSVVAFGAAWFVMVTVAGNAHEIFGRESSGIDMVPAVKAAIAAEPPGTPFYSVQLLDHTLPFYLGHTMIMVENADELSFGVAQEPAKWVPTIAQWVARWRAAPHALALMRPGMYDHLAAQGVPMRVVARDARRVVVAKPAP